MAAGRKRVDEGPNPKPPVDPGDNPIPFGRSPIDPGGTDVPMRPLPARNMSPIRPSRAGIPIQAPFAPPVAPVRRSPGATLPLDPGVANPSAPSGLHPVGSPNRAPLFPVRVEPAAEDDAPPTPLDPGDTDIPMRKASEDEDRKPRRL